MEENGGYLSRQLITYIGNKRVLLDFIGEGVRRVQERLGKKKLSIADMFSGSGAAARSFMQFADLLIVNDLEAYSAVINRCYLSPACERDMAALRGHYAELKSRLAGQDLRAGFITELYAPRDDDHIQAGERVFYTRRNAMYIDTARQLIEELPEGVRPFFIAPLLSEASIHTNTSGVFKGFYKNRETGAGQFGGNNSDSLYRIKGPIELPFPLFSAFSPEVRILSADANVIAGSLPELDLAYIDPPYNQHPYGSNYFMLNLIAEYRRPERISAVSGIPPLWNRSAYNKPQRAAAAFRELVTKIKAPFLLISFNSEGFIGFEQMKSMLQKLGRLEVLETRYNTFRGGRNLGGRSLHVKEYLYLLEKDSR